MEVETTMARIIEVTPEQLETTAGKIEGLAADYKTQYEKLYSETSAMANTWNGKDNVAFVNQIDGFKDDLQKMHNEMIKYAEYLRQTAKAYRDTQDNVVAEARKLAN
jgi:WXG100 family type VII secretion target